LLDYAALPVGEAHYLVDRAPPIQVLGSERDVVAAHFAASDERPWRVVVVGAPDYGESAAEPGRDGALSAARTAPFRPLDKAEEESRTIAALWNAGDAEARVLLGGAATEEALRREAPGARVLHFATHGYASARAAPAG